jgi:carbon-monoxide dehydrogenase medium subunit
MRDVAYHEPVSIGGALGILDQYGEDAQVIAGGTGLILGMKQGLPSAGHIVGLRKIPGLRGISRTADGGLQIGALTTHRQIETSANASDYCAAFPRSFAWLATIRIRNAGTIGGNLSEGNANYDPPTMLMGFGAQAVLVSSAGERSVSLDDFFLGAGKTACRRGEFLTRLLLPPQPSSFKWLYSKFRARSVVDSACVAVAAGLDLDGDHVVKSARIVLGAAGPTPIRASKAEAAIQNQRLTPSLIKEAGALARDASEPVSDLRGSADYKRDMVAVFTESTLEDLSNGK